MILILVRRTGFAVIVDVDKGLAVISRSIVPFDLGALTLTFAQSIVVPGKVLLSKSLANHRSSTCIQR